jgi:hypothetical protein
VFSLFKIDQDVILPLEYIIYKKKTKVKIRKKYKNNSKLVYNKKETNPKIRRNSVINICKDTKKSLKLFV